MTPEAQPAQLDPFFLPSRGRMGDTMPFFRDGLCHLFHMQPPVIGHHVSTDLVHWRERPVVVSPGAAGEPDSRSCATGTVVEHDGRFYFFYTGNQNVCLATSDDLDHWTKHPGNPVLEGDDRQCDHAYFRDPFVFFHGPEHLWWMLVGTRVPGRTAQRAGCVGLAKSSDLVDWRLCRPLWAPGIGPHTDCPQLLHHAGRWYLLYLQRNTRYRVADSPTGPFRRPPTRDLMTRMATAGSRPAFDGKRWITFATVISTQDDAELGPWQFGGPLAVPRQLDFHEDGSITERPADEIIAAARGLPGAATGPLNGARLVAGRWDTPDSGTARSLSDDGGTLLLTDVAADLYLEADVTLASRHMDAQVLLRVDDALLTGYQLGLHPETREVTVRPISASDTDRVLVARSVELPPERPIKLRVFLSGSVLEAFVGDRVSVTARLFQHRSGSVALGFRDAPGTFSDLPIRSLRT